MLSFVEFLSQIFSRCLTGDLNHGQLLAIASHVAGGLTDTVIVVFLYQKVCGWSKSFKNIQSNKPASRGPAKNIPHDTQHSYVCCHRSLSMKANNDWSQKTEEGVKKSSAGFIWYQWSTGTSQIFLMEFLNNDFTLIFLFQQYLKWKQSESSHKYCLKATTGSWCCRCILKTLMQKSHTNILCLIQ